MVVENTTREKKLSLKTIVGFNTIYTSHNMKYSCKEGNEMTDINTKILKIDKDAPQPDLIKEAARILNDKGVVAFPTETVYGLGANALDKEAISKIFQAKGRPEDNPLIVHIENTNQLKDLTEDVSEKAHKIMERFWPGPLTIIFKKGPKVPYTATGGLDTVAVRMPNHKIALELIKEANLPIAAPSANISGKPSPTEASHVIEDLAGRIHMIIDGGDTGVGVESTVLDVSGDIPFILRPGGVTKEDLLEIFPRVAYDPAIETLNSDIAPRSPGQKYRHYSPKAKMTIIQGSPEATVKEIINLYKSYNDQGLRVGIMATEETQSMYGEGTVLVSGSRKKPETIAANLFKSLRKFDTLEVDIILAEGVEEAGIGKAIMNRMKKAASGETINV